MTRDVILTLSLLLVAGLFARLLATLLHVPEIVFLLGIGALLGPVGARRASTSRWTRSAPSSCSPSASRRSSSTAG